MGQVCTPEDLYPQSMSRKKSQKPVKSKTPIEDTHRGHNMKLQKQNNGEILQVANERELRARKQRNDGCNASQYSRYSNYSQHTYSLRKRQHHKFDHSQEEYHGKRTQKVTPSEKAQSGCKKTVEKQMDKIKQREEKEIDRNMLSSSLYGEESGGSHIGGFGTHFTRAYSDFTKLTKGVVTRNKFQQTFTNSKNP